MEDKKITQMNMNILASLGVLLMLVFSLGLVSGLRVSDVDYENLSPGEQGIIIVKIKNTLDEDIEDVSLTLDLSGVNFVPIRSAKDNVDEIRDGDSERFDFKVKVSNDIEPGDYSIPYTLEYNVDGDNRDEEGEIGIVVEANPELSFSVSTDNPVIGQKGKITLKIVNSGFSDARFVSVRINPQRFTLLSEKQVYVGNVNSDDFESVSFEVIFKEANPVLNAIVEYKDFDNSNELESVNLPVTVYTQKRAQELGIIPKSNSSTYFGVLVLVVAGLFWRRARKKKRLREAQDSQL